jgi:hypothetical protein
MTIFAQFWASEPFHCVWQHNGLKTQTASQQAQQLHPKREDPPRLSKQLKVTPVSQMALVGGETHEQRLIYVKVRPLLFPVGVFTETLTGP